MCLQFWRLLWWITDKLYWLILFSVINDIGICLKQNTGKVVLSNISNKEKQICVQCGAKIP